MTDNNEAPTTTAGNNRRRSSFAGQTFAEIFGSGRSRPSISTDNNAAAGGPTSQFPGPITSAAAQVQRRRMSITQMGLSGSPIQTTPNLRRDSGSTANSDSIDESAVEEGFGPDQSQNFGRRLSFGARAMKDVKTGGAAAGTGGGTDRPNGRSSIAETGVSPKPGDVGKKTAPPQVKGRGEAGYNWADSFRSRAQRSSSISMGSPPNPSTHVRSNSVAMMQPPPPAQAPKAAAPDHFQERILKGDFYMD